MSAALECKICGGTVRLSQDGRTGVCEYCGRELTIAKIDLDQRTAIFNRGNFFRRQGEFDKALQVFERIIQEDDADAEAHWCCALSRYGIQYVEDPATKEYKPTFNRASYDLFTQDIDYLAAIQNSEGEARQQYLEDGAKITALQKEIIAAARHEKPYDVFICYKESEPDGSRTKESVLAQDIYYQLTDQGYRVFFSRITLEEKAGEQYEPIIFAALNSAKVMVVVGTSKEHLEAVWVKNEWSRFLSIMKRDRGRVILPCYRDMSPYDMPDALSVLQSYDMSRIGFLQDLIRGIGKIVSNNSNEAKRDNTGSKSAPDAEIKDKIQEKTKLGQKTLVKGNAAFSAKNYSEAYRLYSDVLEHLPDNFTALYRKGICVVYQSAAENLRIDELKSGVALAVGNGSEREIRAGMPIMTADLRDMANEFLGRWERSRRARQVSNEIVCQYAKLLEFLIEQLSNTPGFNSLLERTIALLDPYVGESASVTLSAKEMDLLRDVRNSCVEYYNSLPSRLQKEQELRTAVAQLEQEAMAMNDTNTELREEVLKNQTALINKDKHTRRKYIITNIVLFLVTAFCVFYSQSKNSDTAGQWGIIFGASFILYLYFGGKLRRRRLEKISLKWQQLQSDPQMMIFERQNAEIQRKAAELNTMRDELDSFLATKKNKT